MSETKWIKGWVIKFQVKGTYRTSYSPIFNTREEAKKQLPEYKKCPKYEHVYLSRHAGKTVIFTEEEKKQAQAESERINKIFRKLVRF